jgi:hypothetical protein
MVEDVNACGYVFRKLYLGQRAIAKKTLGAWDDVNRPNRIIICDDSPITLKWDAVFEYIKGESQGTGDRQTNDEQTMNERQTRDRRIEGVSQWCVPKSGKRVSNGEATESIGLSIKVVSV